MVTLFADSRLYCLDPCIFRPYSQTRPLQEDTPGGRSQFSLTYRSVFPTDSRIKTIQFPRLIWDVSNMKLITLRLWHGGILPLNPAKQEYCQLNRSALWDSQVCNPACTWQLIKRSQLGHNTSEVLILFDPFNIHVIVAESIVRKLKTSDTHPIKFSDKKMALTTYL